MEMIAMEVIPKDNHVLINLDNLYSGYADICVFRNPSMLDKERILKKKTFFSDGIGILELEDKKYRFFLKTIIEGKVYIGAYRRVPIDGLYNLRDLGGYLNRNGRMVKWGLIYRSDALDHLSEVDITYLKKMKISSIIDFRSPEEMKHNPDIYVNERYHYLFDPHAETAKNASAIPSKKEKIDKDEEKVRRLEKLAQTDSGKKQLIQMQNQMVDQMQQLVLSEHAKRAYTQFLKVLICEEVPTIFHCQGGKDRTGWAAAIVLGLLDVDKKTIYEDYLLTNIYNEARNEKRMAIYQQYTNNTFVLDYLGSLQKTLEKYLDSAFQAMESHYENMEQYAKQALGLTDQEIEKLRRVYLYDSCSD